MKECNVKRAVSRQLRGHFSCRNKHDEQCSYSNRLVFLFKLTDEMQALFFVFREVCYPSPCLSAACCLATSIFKLAFTALRIRAPLQHHALPLPGLQIKTDIYKLLLRLFVVVARTHMQTHTLPLFSPLILFFEGLIVTIRSLTCLCCCLPLAELSLF